MRGGWIVLLSACGRLSFDDSPPDAPLDTVDTAPPDVTIPACTVAACPLGFALVGGGCYQLVTAPATWLDAELACEAMGAHLVAEDTIQEHFDMHTLAASEAEVWIGWTDRRGPDNVFAWIVPVTGELLQSNGCVFGAGEPDAGDGDHCVAQMGANTCGDYNDIDCALLRPYICECDGQLADPSRY